MPVIQKKIVTLYVIMSLTFCAKNNSYIMKKQYLFSMLFTLVLAVIPSFKASAAVIPSLKASATTAASAFPLHKASASMRHKVPADASIQAQSFGFLDGTDGMTWHFTQENESEFYTYTKSTVTVYNSKRELEGSFTVEVPEGMAVNMIEPFGLVTTKLFDKNASTKEVLVYLHEMGNADNGYKGKDHLYAYTIGGGKVAEFEGDGMIVDASPNGWTLLQRLVVSHEDADGVNTDIDIYRAPSWGDDTAVLDKTFQYPTLNLTYIDGPIVNFYKIDNNPYIVISHYEKPFVEYDEDGNQVMDYETFMPHFTEDNSFVIETFDKNYNLVSSFSVPTNVHSDKYITRMNSFGVFGDKDFTRGFFSGDDKFNYVILNNDVTQTTEYVASYVVYDQDGRKVRTIAENVGDNFKKLADIKGKEDQWIFIDAEGTSIVMVDLPSCRKNALPERIDDYGISFNIDRIPADNEAGYQYVMGVNEATTNETGTDVIAMFAYLNADFSTDHYVYINMGPLAQTFTPLLSKEGLDPYLFNTDDLHEFLFFSKVRDDNEETGGHNALFIANDNGEIVETFNLAPGNEKGDIWSAMIMNYGSDSPSLFVNYYNWDEDTNTIEFYDMPLKKFAAGGDGSADNPYLISSVGDLAQVVKEPSASYRVAKNFDAYGYPVSMESFSGELDGNGKTISNLDVTSDNYYGGLFGNAAGARIHDLTLDSPVGDVTDGNQQFGILSGFAISTAFDNIVIKDAVINNEHSYVSPLGVIAGMASAETTVSDCYIDNATVNSNSRVVGGAVGEMRTSSLVANTAVANSHLTANGELGAITGIIGTGCKVNDCSVSATELTANNFLGGVAGRCGVSSSRGIIERCIVSATLNCPLLSDNADNVAECAVGGIAGYVEPDWQYGGQGMISGNVLYECWLKSLNSNFYHIPELRIVGCTINDEDETRVETGLNQNYQKPFNLDGAAVETEYEANSVYGKILNAGEVPAIDFWTGLGYQFGDSSVAPWNYAENNRPYLYLETGSPISGISTVTPAGKPAIMNGIYTVDGRRVANTSKSGLYIINGKKVIR